MKQGLISIKPEHVNNILKGRKTVELRTRRLHLPIGSKLWIYTTLPKGRIESVVEISFIITEHPKVIWEKYENEMCITKETFDEYTYDKDLVSAIGFCNLEITNKDLSLNTLRTFDKKFMPPQFFINLTPDKKIFAAFA